MERWSFVAAAVTVTALVAGTAAIVLTVWNQPMNT